MVFFKRYFFSQKAEWACFLVFSNTLLWVQIQPRWPSRASAVFYRRALGYLGVKCLELGYLGNRDVLKGFFSYSRPSDQPEHVEEENCAVIRTESSGRWQNRDCSVALPYVCKKRPNATMDPFTTGQCGDIFTSSYCRSAKVQNVLLFIFWLPQTRGQMMRNISVMWAGRPSRPAATSWPRIRYIGIQLRKPVRGWRPTWSVSTPSLSWSSSYATWRKVGPFFMFTLDLFIAAGSQTCHEISSISVPQPSAVDFTEFNRHFER